MRPQPPAAPVLLGEDCELGVEWRRLGGTSFGCAADAGLVGSGFPRSGDGT
ncbi:hypothetical protein KBZ21_03910 [Streptomyces sp. A73]|nr:hypothetical protein [Streptomyces sp. B15]MBQ1157320.1 hypothetical protein [Streptomyces sp. A73]